MKSLNIVTLLLTIVGGLNWGMIALADTDLVANLFGAGTAASKAVYGLVGVSALWQLIPLFRAIGRGEVNAEAGVRRAL